MFNEVILIGRIVDDLYLKEVEGNRKVCNILLAVTRPFKNSDGEYDTDFIKVCFWDSFAKNACEYCLKGDMVCVKGRLCVKTQEVYFDQESDKQKIYQNEVVGERIIFLQPGHKKTYVSEPEYED